MCTGKRRIVRHKQKTENDKKVNKGSGTKILPSLLPRHVSSRQARVRPYLSSDYSLQDGHAMEKIDFSVSTARDLFRNQPDRNNGATRFVCESKHFYGTLSSTIVRRYSGR